MKNILFTFLLAASFIGCKNSSEEKTEEKTPELSINYKKITLDNGLDVVFHVDKSDPVVAVELM
ncbi:MAG: hypothetical protein ACKVIG_11010, partial [Flavobacteriales bacterium]